MRAAGLEVRYTDHRGLMSVVNDFQKLSGHRRTLVESRRSFFPVKLPFNVISIHRVKSEYVVFLNSFFK